MAGLFDVDRSRITRHINNIFNDNELDKKSNVRKTHFANSDKKVNLYNLNVVLVVGYRVNSTRGILFRKWSNRILKEYLLKGYVINENRVLVTNENYVELINKLNKIDSHVKTIENIITNKSIPMKKIFYNGEIYDVYSFLQDTFIRANNEIIIIDNFIDKTILDRLVVKKQNVKVTIYTDPNKSHLLGIDINTFNKQYPTLDVKYSTLFHDRFIIIDRTDLYLVGASLKDAGNKCFAITKIEDKDLLESLITKYTI